MSAGIEARVKEYLNITGDETLADKYNVKITQYVATGTKVAALGEETRALRDGKGTDLIIGCANNVDATEGTSAGMTTVAKKQVPTSFMEKGRYIALIHENPLARDVYENYFVEAAAPEQGA